MNRMLTVMRHPTVRTLFVLAAVGMAAWALVSRWDQVREGLAAFSWMRIAMVVLLSLVYVVCTQRSWRAVVNDLGASVGWRTTSAVFYISQVGKYLPGGVWNIVAAAELGVDRGITRARSVAAMIISILLAIITGTVFGLGAVLFGPDTRLSGYWWTALLIPVLVVLLWPRVLNRILALAYRLLKKAEPAPHVSGPAVLVAALWAFIGWIVAGTQVWALGVGVGMPGTGSTLALALGGYALAWIVGFLAVIAPAGLGVREVILGLALQGQLDPGGVVIVVLLSRTALTLGDFALGAYGALLTRGFVTLRSRGRAKHEITREQAADSGARDDPTATP